MAVTCAKGHVNDDTNRFCDQCGLPLQAAPAVAPQEVTFVSMPAAGASSVACPVCGQENVPGTAFCDNCGAVLPPPQPAVDQQDAAGAAPIAQAQPDAATVVCPSCGTSNDAVNRFCENCGASLVPAEAGANAQSNGGSPADGATIVEDQNVTIVEDTAPPAAEAAETAAVQPASPEGEPLDSAPPIAAQGDSVPPAVVVGEAASATEQALVDTVPEPGAEMDAVAVEGAEPQAPVAEASTSLPGQPEEPTALPGQPEGAETPPPAEETAAPTVDSDAERTRLEGEIATQRRLVEQLEGMEQSFGAATPPAIKQGLDEARAALSRAEQQLEQLPPPAPAADPAEVARLEGEIATQRRLVEQLEGMEQSFGAATPPAIKQGLDEARAALSRAEQELADLTGTSIAPAAAGAAPASDAADVPAPVAEAQELPAEFAPPAVEFYSSGGRFGVAGRRFGPAWPAGSCRAGCTACA